MNLYDAFFHIVRQFQQRRIDYAVVGGVALAFHSLPRMTRDVDILITPEDLDLARQGLDELGYVASAPPWTFQSTDITLHRFLKVAGEDYVVVDLLIGNGERHRAIVAQAREEPWAEGVVRFATKDDLIWLKRQRDSDQDRVDIKRLSDDTSRARDQGTE